MLRVDSRASDAIAIAVRAGCPIYAADEVMDLAGQDASDLLSIEEQEEGDDTGQEDGFFDAE